MAVEADAECITAAKEFTRTAVLSLKDKIDAVFLSGTASKGGGRPSSDIDLSIVTRYSKDQGFVNELNEIADGLEKESDSSFFISLFFIDTGEFEKQSASDDPFVRSGMKDSIKLYTRQ